MEFIERLTPEELKELCRDHTIKVLRNPVTSKIFFTCGSRGGKVSSKGVPNTPTFSICHDTKTSEPSESEMAHIGKTILVDGTRQDDPAAGGYFLLLHEEQESPNLVTTF